MSVQSAPELLGYLVKIMKNQKGSHWYLTNLGFHHELGLLSGQSFAPPPSVHVGFLWVLQFLPTSKKHSTRLIGCAKLSHGVNGLVSHLGCIPILCSWDSLWTHHELEHYITGIY